MLKTKGEIFIVADIHNLEKCERVGNYYKENILLTTEKQVKSTIALKRLPSLNILL
jgi:hypothetical protein